MKKTRAFIIFLTVILLLFAITSSVIAAPENQRVKPNCDPHDPPPPWGEPFCPAQNEDIKPVVYLPIVIRSETSPDYSQ